MKEMVTGHFAKDFLHKSFSTSFGPFAQFLVVISHNYHKCILIDTDKTFHLHMIQRRERRHLFEGLNGGVKMSVVG